jgi:hypothetical protein
MLERGANHPEAYTGLWSGMKHVVRTRGFKGLWAGFTPSSLGVAHGAVQFSIYEKMKHRRGAMIGGEHNLSNWEYIYMSGGSKLLAGAITYPYQPIRARMQTYDASKNYNGLFDVLRKTWKNEGFLAFYKGSVFLNGFSRRRNNVLPVDRRITHANVEAESFLIPSALYQPPLSRFLFMKT